VRDAVVFDSLTKYTGDSFQPRLNPSVKRGTNSRREGGEMTLGKKAKRVFISHRCLEFDHGIVYTLQHELQLDGHTVFVDPFIGGDRTRVSKSAKLL
jgi:hypothetical protein